MALGIPANALGLIVAGDVGGYTIYTDRHGRKVVFPRSPPKKPPSPMQIKQRARFAQAVTNWRNATQLTRDQFEALSMRANICMTGHNLFIALSLRDDPKLFDTLKRQTGLPAPLPVFIVWPPS